MRFRLRQVDERRRRLAYAVCSDSLSSNAAAEITSGYDIESFTEFGDIVVVVGRFFGTMTMRDTTDVRSPEGRLTLVYKRDENGARKMILDLDNNGAE